MTDFTFGQILANLLLAARWTIVLSIVSFVSGGIVGLGLLVMRVSNSAVLRGGARLYIEVFQGTPLLMQLFIVFFGLPLVGLDVPPWVAATAGLTFVTSADLAEIWRGCVEAVPKGQWEASASLAMSYVEQLRHVILPQAARIAISNATFRPFVVYGLVALIYFALCYPLTRYARTLQRRWHAAR